MIGLPEADTVIATILTLLVCGKEAYGTDCSVTKLRCPPFRAQPSGCERRVLPGSLRNTLALFMRFMVMGMVSNASYAYGLSMTLFARAGNGACGLLD